MLCSKCHIEKNVDNFSFKSQAKKRRQKICKQCHSTYRKEHYLLNKDKYIAKALKWNKKQGEVLSKYLFDKLSNAQCIDCGEKDVIVLEFDHLNDKQFSISDMYKNRYSLEAVKKELTKCVIRCANCHRKKTARDSKFWKFKMLNT